MSVGRDTVETTSFASAFPEMDIYSPKTACGCPCGGVIQIKKLFLKGHIVSEFRSCVKVEVVVLGLPSLISLMDVMDLHLSISK